MPPVSASGCAIQVNTFPAVGQNEKVGIGLLLDCGVDWFLKVLKLPWLYYYVIIKYSFIILSHAQNISHTFLMANCTSMSELSNYSFTMLS